MAASLDMCLWNEVVTCTWCKTLKPGTASAGELDLFYWKQLNNTRSSDRRRGSLHDENLPVCIGWMNYQLKLLHSVCLNLTAISSLTLIPYLKKKRKKKDVCVQHTTLPNRRSLCLLTSISSSHGNRLTSSRSLCRTRKRKGEKPSSPLLLPNLNAKCRSRKVSIPLRTCRLLADLLSTTAQFSRSGREMRGESFTGTQPTLGTHLRAYERTATASLQASHVRTARWMRQICSTVPKAGCNLQQMPVGSSPTRDQRTAAYVFSWISARSSFKVAQHSLKQLYFDVCGGAVAVCRRT